MEREFSQWWDEFIGKMLGFILMRRGFHPLGIRLFNDLRRFMS